MIQVVPQTKKQRKDMYMKMPKKELVRMIMECVRIIESIDPCVRTYSPTNDFNPDSCRHLEGDYGYTNISHT